MTLETHSSSDYVYKQYIQMAAGSSVQNLNKEKVQNLFLYLPEKKEQAAISNALSDMDNEIVSLMRNYKKICDTKQGMMQQLLTGKIRLM